MNSHNRLDHDPFDIFIGRSLKNWLERQYPPADAKDKLLYAASIDSLEKTGILQFGLIFLRGLSLRIDSLLAIHLVQPQYSIPCHDSLSINDNFQNWRAYQMMIRSFPTGRGLLGFLY
jgi:hypothetical protein